MNKRALGTLAFAHLVNDFLNGVVGAILPLLKVHFQLTYGEVGTLIMVSNVSSSLVQPLFGYVSDKKGNPWLLVFSAMALGLGLFSLPYAPSFLWLLPAVMLSGIGSAAFHPDASRAVYFAAGGKRGVAQSAFQIGGNSGMALSALSLLFLGHVGLSEARWFMIPAVVSTLMLTSLSRWFAAQLVDYQRLRRERKTSVGGPEPSRFGLPLLVSIVTVRAWIISGVITFVPLYVVQKFGVASANVWTYSFVFMLFGALGTVIGGPLADRFGQRTIVRLSMIASTPFALILPFLPRALMLVDLAPLGFWLLSTFAVTVVYGQELKPGNIAMVSGLLIGFAGGIGGIGTFLMGTVADHYGLHHTLVWIVWIMPIAALCTLGLPMDGVKRDRIKQPKLRSDPVRTDASV